MRILRLNTTMTAAEYLPHARLGDEVRVEGYVQGVVGSIDGTRGFFVYQNRHDGNRPDNWYETHGQYGYSWGVSGSTDVTVLRRGRGRLARPVRVPRWVDKTLPSIGIADYKPTKLVQAACDALAASYTSGATGASIAQSLKAAARNKYVEKISTQQGCLSFTFRAALVKEHPDYRQCRSVAGFVAKMQSNGSVSVKSRDYKELRHPNVNREGRLCRGDNEDMMREAVRRGDMVTFMTLLTHILYGDGQHGYGSWPEYFRQRTPERRAEIENRERAAREQREAQIAERERMRQAWRDAFPIRNTTAQ